MSRIKLKSLRILLLLALSACAQRGEAAMKISSPAFENNQTIPAKYTCQGEDINPPLEISGIPDGTQSLALIVDDPDAPMGTWVHWLAYNIPANMTEIAQHSIPGLQGMNSFQQLDYGGPCPPSGTHRYFFKVYALDIMLRPKANCTKAELEKFMTSHILDQGQLIGLYKKK